MQNAVRRYAKCNAQVCKMHTYTLGWNHLCPPRHQIMMLWQGWFLGVPRGCLGVPQKDLYLPNQSGFPISCNQNPTSRGFQSVAIRTQPVRVSNQLQSEPNQSRFPIIKKHPHPTRVGVYCASLRPL